MKYALHVRFNGAKAALEALPPVEQQAIFAEFAEVRGTTGVLDGNQLDPPATATTVYVHDGHVHRSDGALAGAIDGYYLYEASDLAAAIEFAARIPVARMGATVEIRRVHQ